MAKSDWKKPFLQLQQSIEPMIALNNRLFHSNVCLPIHDRQRASAFSCYLEAAHMAEELAGIIETPTAGCGFHGHFFFGSSAVLQQMGTLLKDLHSRIDDMPEGILPAFALPRTARQTTHNLALWSNILLALTCSQSRWHFAADVEFQQQLDQIEFALWEELNQPPHLNPMAVLTHQKEIEVPFKQWKKRFEDNQLAIPEYFGAYLRDSGEQICGDFLKASMSAIDIIVYVLTERCTQVLTEGRTPNTEKKNASQSTPRRNRSNRAKPRKGEVFSDDGVALLVWLLTHHGCSTGNPTSEAFDNQTRVAKELTARGTNFEQVRVSRTLEQLMNEIPRRQQVFKENGEVDGDKTYHKLCESQTICEMLNMLHLKSNQFLDHSLSDVREFATENIEGFSNRGF